MKMIYVGSLTTEPDRDSSWIYALEKLGCHVIPFSSEIDYSERGFLQRWSGKVCKRLSIGRRNRVMQDALLALAERERPNWIHFRLPLGFDRRTIATLKARRIVVTQYFADDPFSRRTPIGIHWKFRHALTAYDGHFVWRAADIQNYKRVGATFVEHCPPHYDPESLFLDTRSPGAQDFLADAAFIGHWEADWRVDCLDALVNSGLSVILKGGDWDRVIRGRRIGDLAPISHAFGVEYCRTYANVVAGLCFFSKINNDGWTKRALEIVAVGGLLVCERTDEAKQYFKDRDEAYFFSSIDELIAIVNELKRDPVRRERVCAAGLARLLESDTTIHSRAKQVYQFALNAVTETARSHGANSAMAVQLSNN